MKATKHPDGRIELDGTPADVAQVLRLLAPKPLPTKLVTHITADCGDGYAGVTSALRDIATAVRLKGL